ncbi:hypothetical protein ZWY2020_032248 [Hordeum vulgare]|nr:hypothetical protein ZWY2020_032248 [Hordeum vulgare]
MGACDSAHRKRSARSAASITWAPRWAMAAAASATWRAARRRLTVARGWSVCTVLSWSGASCDGAAIIPVSRWIAEQEAQRRKGESCAAGLQDQSAVTVSNRRRKWRTQVALLDFIYTAPAQARGK